MELDNNKRWLAYDNSTDLLIRASFPPSPYDRHSKRRIYFSRREAASELYVVCTGKVQLSKTTEEGRELLLRICEQGDAFGEIVPFQSMCVCTVSAKMMEAGTLAVINKQQLEEKLTTDHAFALQFMQWIHLQLQRMQAKVRDLILHGKKVRFIPHSFV